MALIDKVKLGWPLSKEDTIAIVAALRAAAQPPALQTVSDEDWQRALDCACSCVDKKFISRATLDNAMQHAFGMLSLRASPPAQLHGEAVAWRWRDRPELPWTYQEAAPVEHAERQPLYATPADAIAREREACAKLIEETKMYGGTVGHPSVSYTSDAWRKQIAAAIRARTASPQDTGGQE